MNSLTAFADVPLSPERAEICQSPACREIGIVRRLIGKGSTRNDVIDVPPLDVFPGHLRQKLPLKMLHQVLHRIVDQRLPVSSSFCAVDQGGAQTIAHASIDPVLRICLALFQGSRGGWSLPKALGLFGICFWPAVDAVGMRGRMRNNRLRAKLARDGRAANASAEGLTDSKQPVQIVAALALVVAKLVLTFPAREDRSAHTTRRVSRPSGQSPVMRSRSDACITAIQVFASSPGKLTGTSNANWHPV